MHEVTPSRSLKEKQRQEREDLILQVTEEVLLEKGYRDASMDEIAARVGIAKGTLYLHFARKEDLVFALLKRQLQSIQQMIAQTQTMSGTAQERLAFVLRSMYVGLFGKLGQLLYTLINTTDLVAIMKERHSDIMTEIANQIRALHEEGKRNGEFDPTLPTDVMVSTFLSVLSPQAYKRMVLGGKMSPEDLIRYVGCIYFRGIAACKDTDETSK